MSDLLPIPKGALFTISTGEYSDYSIQGVFRAVEELNTQALRDEWITTHPEHADAWSFHSDAFLAYLVKRNLIELVDSWEWHLESYSSIEDMYVHHLENPL